MSRRCIMGCPKWENLHRFPNDPIRRSEWLRMLGVKSSMKRIFACSRHFSDEFIFGNKTSKFAIPLNESGELNENDELNAGLENYSGVSGSNVVNSTRVPIIKNVKKEKFDDFSIGNELTEVYNVSFDTDDQRTDVGYSEIDNTEMKSNDLDVRELDIENSDIDKYDLDCNTNTRYSSKLKALQTALDYYRTQYLSERRLKSKLRADNVRLSNQLDECKEKIAILELELVKKNMSAKLS